MSESESECVCVCVCVSLCVCACVGEITGEAIQVERLGFHCLHVAILPTPAV